MVTKPQKSYGWFVFGCILLVIVDFLWTLSSILVQELLEHYYDKPIIITYCSTSVFALYVPVFFLSNAVRSWIIKCRLRRLLREKYQQSQDHFQANETTSLISHHHHHSGTSSSPTHSTYHNNQAYDTNHTPSNHQLDTNDTSYQYDQIPNSSSNEPMSAVQIEDRVNYELKHLDQIETTPGSQIYNDIQSSIVLSNERGWTVFKHNFKAALILGPLWYTMNVTYNSALKMVSVSTNTILSTTAGFFVLLIGFVVFCVPIKKLHLLCVVIAIFGSFCVTYLGADGSEADVKRSLFDKIIGPSLCLLSAFLYGLYSVVIEYFTDREKPLEEQKDSIAKQRQEAEEEEIEERRQAEIEAQTFYFRGGSSSFSGTGGGLERSITAISINTTEYQRLGDSNKSATAPHASPATHSIDDDFFPEKIHCQAQFDQTVLRHQQQSMGGNNNNDGKQCGLQESDQDILAMTFEESDEETDVEPPPINLDPNSPKLITGLLFGCVGVINLFFAWPFIGLFHLTGFERLEFPSTRAIPMIVMNSFLGAACSDFLWANAVILTSPIIATLTIPGTIPLAMLYETIILKKALKLFSVLGSILIVFSSSVVTIHQYFTDKHYDKLTSKMLAKREEKKAREKSQRRAYHERQLLLLEEKRQNELNNIDTSSPEDKLPFTQNKNISRSFDHHDNTPAGGSIEMGPRH